MYPTRYLTTVRHGSGTTPENPNMTAIEQAYDGLIVAGYFVWSEFIAQYYAIKKTAKVISLWRVPFC
ncbi:hypothetical protein FACS1894208_01750 [Clostridia bacterium]|nr:hypothetical protein FACS1894208_01750 [Clostridia bacterium]